MLLLRPRRLCFAPVLFLVCLFWFLIFVSHFLLHCKFSLHIFTNIHELTWCKVKQGSSLTVCAAADRGVLCTGVRRWLRLSHSTICPEYVPPPPGWDETWQSPQTPLETEEERGGERGRGWATHWILLWCEVILLESLRKKNLLSGTDRRRKMVSRGIVCSDKTSR